MTVSCIEAKQRAVGQLAVLLLCTVGLIHKLEAASIPDKLVVLTFDDSAKSHFTIVRPILKKYGFGATFFITEGFDFAENKRDYMTWPQIAQLHQDGFEIGNHTRDHLGITDKNSAELETQLLGIDKRCAQHGIPKPISFAWPGNAISVEALAILKDHGIRFARRGGVPEFPYQGGRGFAYEPGLDDPRLIPSAGDARPDWELADLIRAVEQARHGKIAVLQFHGVPDTAHDWVNTPQTKFEAYMNYLAVNGYTVIAMRDLARYVDADLTPANPMEVIEDRTLRLARRESFDNFRTPTSREDLQYWLKNMRTHGYDVREMSAATGLSIAKLEAALRELQVADEKQPPREAGRINVLPYPGGRHPRIGFLDGAMRPQRDTKVSVFLPWAASEYVVVDVPEAIWWKQTQKRELLYLAHTHVPTIWDRESIRLKPLEWIRHDNGRLSFERRLPNGVRFGASVMSDSKMVRMELSITNGTAQPMRELYVQNCVMLKAASEFNSLTVSNKLYREPYAACSSSDGKRWIITAWQHCARPWGNDRCPCLHSDPQFPDCMPGQTQRLRGILTFYEGRDVQAEFDRLDALDWIGD